MAAAVHVVHEVHSHQPWGHQLGWSRLAADIASMAALARLEHVMLALLQRSSATCCGTFVTCLQCFKHHPPAAQALLAVGVEQVLHAKVFPSKCAH